MGSSQCKRKLGKGLFTEQAEWCRMIAIPISRMLLPGVGDPTKESVLGGNSTEFVEAPLNVLLQYYFRARNAACR